MWMAAGFAMLEAGLVRSKNVSMQCLKNIALYSIAGLMFWVIGYSTDVHQRQRRLFRHAAAL
jgi:Amt family ammonium transporter